MEEGRSRRASAATLAVALSLVLAAAAAPAGAVRIRASSTLAGTVLTNGAGYVLMMFPKEGHSLARCLEARPCMSDWPPLTTTARPVAGPGVDPGLLGTIRYRGGLREVTYAGWPLHTYKFAYSAQSSVMNIGIRQFGGNWYALTPTGKVVK